MRRALGLAAGALLFGGCHPDVCSGGTCVDVTVVSDGTVGQVDQLELRVLGAAAFGPGRTSALGSPVALPVTTDILIPPNRSGEVTVAVSGIAGGVIVGEGAHSVALRPGARASVTVRLTARPPRGVFALAPRTGRLGGRPVIEQACTAAATAAGLRGTFAGLLGYSNIAGPSMTIDLPDGDREILLPDGRLVATDATFFAPNHLAPIDQGAGREHASTECVWTNFTAQGAARTADCAGWTDETLLHGNYGLTTKADVNWADFGGNQTCDALCHVYCIEQ